MNIGHGIAIAGIWIGVGMAGLKGGDGAAMAAIFGMIASAVVCCTTARR